MKNKTKLLMTLISMCLVITLGVIGILAVKKLDLNIGGNVSFTAEGVAFEVSAGKFYTDANHTSEYTGLVSDKMLGFSTDTNTPYNNIKANVESWSGLTLNLDSRGDAYLHFTVTNKMSQTLYIALIVDNGTQDANKNIEIKTITSALTIAGNTATPQDFVFHFDIKDTDVNASLTDFKIDLTFSLVATQVEVNAQGEIQGDLGTKYTGIKYVVDEENNTVTLQNNNIGEEVFIASSVISPSGEVFTVTEVPNGLFVDESGFNTTLRSVVIAEGITIIESDAFWNCTALTSIVIPESVTIIGSSAFGCTALTSIVFPSNIKSIADNIFCGCTSLSSVYIPEGVTKIGIMAFYGCTALEEIVIPSTVTKMDECAFMDSTDLKTIKILAEEAPTINASTFEGIPSTATIVVPNDSYLTKNIWKDLNLVVANS